MGAHSKRAQRPFAPLGIIVVALFAVVALGGLVTWRYLRTVRGRDAPATARTQPATRARAAAANEPKTPGGPLPATLRSPRIVVEKSARRLTVYSAGKPIRRYAIGLGREPIGDKVREGDGRTPEGTFYVCTKNARSKFHLALGLSYPALEDAERGASDGLISAEERDRIRDALKRRAQPPWDTALGGEIMIHGSGWRSGDWTTGCVAMSDREIEFLFARIPLGTPVEIVP